MNTPRTSRFFYVLLVVLFLIAIGALFVGRINAQAQGQSPAPGPASVALGVPQTPSAKWLKDFDSFTKRNAALQAKRAAAEEKLQPEVDALIGLSQRLIQQIPPGHQFDPQRRVFVPTPPPSAPAPQPAPAPAPTPSAAAPAENPSAK